MEGTEVTESLNEWEQVQSPSPHVSPTTQSREWEMVIVRDNSNPQHGLPIFPPSNHEGLQIPPPTAAAAAATEVSQSPGQPRSVVVSNVEGDEERALSGSRPKVGNEVVKRFRLRLEILMRWGMAWVASRVRSYVFCRGGFWTLVSVSVVVGALWLHSRVHRWHQWVLEERKDRLTLLIEQKDQKIGQLLLQIAKMNEMLSARRKVPVLRVG